MARYIDANKFKSNLEKAMEKMHLIGGVKGVDVGAVITALDRQPTADVVPKSEVDEWKERCIGWYEVSYLKSQRILELEAERSKAKGEVDHIFEEIDKILKSCPTEIMGVAYYYRCLVDENYAELKKKYTEEKT